MGEERENVRSCFTNCGGWGGGGGRKCTIMSHQPGFKFFNFFFYVRSYCTNRGGGWRGGMSDRVLPNRKRGGGGGRKCTIVSNQLGDGGRMYDRVLPMGGGRGVYDRV